MSQFSLNLGAVLVPWWVSVPDSSSLAPVASSGQLQNVYLSSGVVAFVEHGDGLPCDRLCQYCKKDQLGRHWLRADRRMALCEAEERRAVSVLRAPALRPPVLQRLCPHSVCKAIAAGTRQGPLGRRALREHASCEITVYALFLKVLRALPVQSLQKQD